MRGPRTTAVLAVALTCAGLGGPALAAVVGHAPQARVHPVAAPATVTAGTIMSVTSTTPTGTTPTGTTSTSTGTGTTPTGTTTSTTTTSTTTTTTTTTTPPPMLVVCLGSVRRLIAASLGVSPAGIATRQFVATNGMPQCNYLIAHARRGGPRGKVVITANVDNGPQPHWRLMRKVVEATQIFGPTPKGFRPPFHIRGLGPDGSWFPALDQMMCNNLHGRYLLTVGVIWPHTTQAEKITITRTVILKYRHIRRLPA